MERPLAAKRPDRPLTILLTEGSSMTAREVLFALGPRHTLDVLDPSPLAQCRFSSLVRRYRRCPSSATDPEGYLQFLLEQLASDAYDVLLPTHEQVYLAARFRDQLAAHAGLAVPEFAALHRTLSKAEFQRLLEELQLPAPPTVVVRRRSELEQAARPPCFLKVDYSTAGNGVRLARDSRELREVADEFERAGWLAGDNEVLVQQPARGAQCVYLAVFQHGRLVGGLASEVRRPGAGGWAMNGLTCDHPVVEQQVEQLGRHLEWHGAMFVDYFYEPQSGQPQYIECNPRLGGAMVGMLAGVDLADLLVRISCGEQLERVPAARAGVRFHQGFLMLISMAVQGASRRQLWSELRTAMRREGFYRDSQDTITRSRDDWLSVVPAVAVSSLLLARPAAAHWLVRRTIDNYAIPESAARRIRQMPLAAGSSTRETGQARHDA